jgi:DNA polymerase-3 subunit alpha
MMDALPRAQAAGVQAQQDAQSGQSSFFDLDGGGNEDAAAHHDPPIMPLPDDRKQLNEWEKETLGLFLSSHPLKEVRPALRAKVDCSLADLAGKKDGEWVTVGGMIAECKRIRTRKGDPMMFATLDDLEGQVELLVFNSAYAANAEKVDVDKIVIVRGRVDKKEEGEIKLVAQEVEAFEPTAEEVAEAAESAAADPIVRRLTIQVAPGVPESFLEDLREVVSHHRGDYELLLAVGERRLLLGPDWRVSADGACRAELAGLTGTFRLVA